MICHKELYITAIGPRNIRKTKKTRRGETDRPSVTSSDLSLSHRHEDSCGGFWLVFKGSDSRVCIYTLC